MLKNNSRTNSYSNYSLSSLAKVDEGNAITEKNKKKELKTELSELRKEINEPEPVTDAEANDDIDNEQKLSSLNDSINSLLDSINNATSLRSSEENLNSHGSMSFLNDSSRSLDFTTFMNNKEKEYEKKNLKKHSKEQLKDDDNVNPFFLLNPELLDSSFSDESNNSIENINVNDSFIKEKESSSSSSEKDKDNEKENDNELAKDDKEVNKIEKEDRDEQTEDINDKIEETENSEFTDTEVSSFKKLGNFFFNFSIHFLGKKFE